MSVPELLARSRTREKTQTLFYRALAAQAEIEGDAMVAERLNELLADEQHHLSRITARLLEMGERPAEEEMSRPPTPYPGWEELAREREEDEIAWYEGMLEKELDPETRGIVEEILRSERHHRDELGGKWMPA